MKPSVGRIVWFAPPQACSTTATLEYYAAMVTLVNADGTLELTTFGPNSLYYQHSIPFADKLTPGHWTWPSPAAAHSP